MRPLVQKHLKAIELRKQGCSYSQIRKELQVSKSSLSLWLNKFPLSDERIRELRDYNQRRIENFRNTWRLKNETRRRKVYENLARELLPLNKKELFIAGLFLYWGEGAKTTPFVTSLSNTNPKVVKFFLFWLLRVVKMPKEKITVRLHLYKDMNQKEEISYWSKELKISTKHFKRPYIKNTTLRGLTFKGFGHGTCNIIIGGKDLTDKILMGIEAVTDMYTARL